MQNAGNRSLWLILGLLLGMLVLSGCFQTAGEPLDPTPVGAGGSAVQTSPTVDTGLGLASPTVQAAFPTETLLAGGGTVLETPTVDTGFATSAPTVDTGAGAVVATPTVDTALGEGQPSGETGDAAAQPTAVVPTQDTGLVDGQGGADTTGGAEGQATVEGESGAAAVTTEAPGQQLDPLLLTATAISGGRTPTLPPVEATQAAGVAPELALQTPTPFEVAQAATPTPTLDLQDEGLVMTATQLVIDSTQNFIASQTAIATASGTYVPTATGTATATPDPTLDCVHVVQRGETAFSIARRYGVTLDQIAQANGLTNLSLLSINQELVIPGCGNAGITPTPVPDDGQGGGSEGGAQRTHRIQPGENLYRIALRYGVTMSALANANGITNINYIRAGDTLIIP